MIELVIYAPEAEQDVVDAYNWYEAREPGLGEDFLRCVEACVQQSLSGLRYVPRQGAGAVGGRIKDFRIYLGDELVRKKP